MGGVACGVCELRWPLARYGTREIAAGTVLLGGAAALAAATLPWLAVVPAALWVFLLSFFRDPERATPEGEARLLSPADGRVADIETVREDEFLHADALRIGIFMSVFNVHVNRAPASGRVAYRGYRPGKFLNALGAAASDQNECSFVGLERPDGTRLLVRQIAGLIARRIVCDCQVGDHLHRGQRFGMVKFGSRLEVYVPASAPFRPTVAVGDRVKAGLTVLGELGADERAPA